MSNDLVEINSFLKTVIFVGGPTGCGKSTLVQALAPFGKTYLEIGENNPFLMSHVNGGPLDAMANQLWFLDQILGFLKDASQPVAIVDQHPLGIGLGYARLFLSSGLLSNDQVISLKTVANGIYSKLKACNIGVLTVHLSASSNVLWQRLTSRQSGPKLDEGWVRQVNVEFQRLLIPCECLPINTEVLTLAEEVQAVTSWLNGENRK